VKLCIDCQHCHRPDFPTGPAFAECEHPLVIAAVTRAPSPVDGSIKVEPHFCEQVRQAGSDLCGLDATLFEGKAPA
jgi:hypothetical protein